MRQLIPFLKKPPVVPVIRLNGVIASGPRGMNDAGLAPLIDKAFARGKPAAVALCINSPGGSPVQSSLIAARIRRLASEKGVEVHAFVEDAAASGGYWLACAGDRIWVDDSSIIGSIGVIFASFGFPEFLARHGIERRVHTAGRSKSLADPFLPEKPEDVARLIAIQEPIHRAFIAHVRNSRGARLRKDADLFNADIWVGGAAVDLGLADGVAHLVPKMKELYGPKVKLVPYGARRSLVQRLGMAMAGGLAQGVAQEIEERGLWAGLGALMLVKAATIFLAVMVALALFGVLRRPGGPRARPPLSGAMRAKGKAAVCRDCGRPQIGSGPCPCTTPRKG